MAAIALQMGNEEFSQYWPNIQKDLDRVPHIWTPWWTKDYIWASVITGKWQVFAAGHDGAIHVFLFTQISYYPANTILQSIMVLGNSIDDSIDQLWAVLEDFARKHDCTRVEVTGRKGWERKLHRFGLRPYGVVLSCGVNELRQQ